MNDTTTTAAKGPTQDAYDAACAALWAHRDRADTQGAALDAIRAWRHLQPHTAAPTEFAGLDAILDSLSLDDEVPLRQINRPTTLPEAVAAYRDVLNARARALNATRLVWDRIEAAAIREIDRHMPHNRD